MMEMDAASRTGVDDIRELTEGVRYRPVSGRYKVYIIDEVHMLSQERLQRAVEDARRAAARTSNSCSQRPRSTRCRSRCCRAASGFRCAACRSRCWSEHYRRIAEAEAVEAEPAAPGADRPRRRRVGARRAVAARPGDRPDRRPGRGGWRCATCWASPIAGMVFDLLESVLRGDAAAALDQLDRLYQDGADPLIVLQDLLELSHFLTRLKLAPEAGGGDPIAEGDRERARPLAEKLSMPVLARIWQMLLKGLEEVQTAPSAIQAAEMVLVRLAYVADLPDAGRAGPDARRYVSPGRGAPPQPRTEAPAATAPSARAPRRGAATHRVRARAPGGRCALRSDTAVEPSAGSPQPRARSSTTRCRKALPKSWRCSTSGAKR